MQLGRIIQPPQHTDSRRMNPTAYPTTHPTRTPEAPLRVGGARGPTRPRGSALEVALRLFVASHWSTEWHPHRKVIISPQPRPDPLVSCTATACSYPTLIHACICWLRRPTSTMAASRTTSPNVRWRTSHPMLLFALFIPCLDHF